MLDDAHTAGTPCTMFRAAVDLLSLTALTRSVGCSFDCALSQSSQSRRTRQDCSVIEAWTARYMLHVHTHCTNNAHILKHWSSLIDLAALKFSDNDNASFGAMSRSHGAMSRSHGAISHSHGNLTRQSKAYQENLQA